MYKATKLDPKELDLMSTLISIICLFTHSFIYSFILFFFHEIFGYSLLVLDIELALGNIIPTAYVFK